MEGRVLLTAHWEMKWPGRPQTQKTEPEEAEKEEDENGEEMAVLYCVCTGSCASAMFVQLNVDITLHCRW